MGYLLNHFNRLQPRIIILFQTYSRLSLEKQCPLSHRHSFSQAVLHGIRNTARLVLGMYVVRVTYLWHLLLSVSVLLFFYLGGRMAGFEERTARFRQPAYTQDTKISSNSAQRGEKKIYVITFFIL